MIPKASNPLYIAVLTTARMAAFMPGESPPEVRTPILVTFFAMNQKQLDLFNTVQQVTRIVKTFKSLRNKA
jgi:hypothetical protein